MTCQSLPSYKGFPDGDSGKRIYPADARGVGSNPEEEMATDSSILAWEIPWTEEPGRLQFMGSQRVGHD